MKKIISKLDSLLWDVCEINQKINEKIIIESRVFAMKMFIDHINFTVDNLNKDLMFFEKIFGFKVKEEGDYSGESFTIIGKENVLLALYEKKIQK